MSTFEILDQKRNNFVKFVRDALTEDNVQNRDKLRKSFEKLKDISLEEFYIWVKDQLAQHKDKTNEYVDKVLKSQGSSLDSLSSENQNKVIRYMDCFIDLCGF